MTAMSFGEAVRMSLTHYATFAGRARRAEYWWFSVLFVGATAGIISTAIAVDSPLASLLALPLIPPMMAVAIRRLHDTGRSGLWMLIALIPFIGPLIYLYLMTIDGQACDNAYGARPTTTNSGH